MSKAWICATLLIAFPGTGSAQSGVGVDVYARDDGALVCETPEPLKIYREVLTDPEAKTKYLKSPHVGGCHQVPKDTAYALAEYVPATIPKGTVLLREKGDFKFVYAVAAEWHTLTSAGRDEQRRVEEQKLLEAEKRRSESKRILEESKAKGQAEETGPQAERKGKSFDEQLREMQKLLKAK